MPAPEPTDSPRSTFASFLLTSLFVAFFLGLLIVCTGGWFLNLLAAFTLIMLFAGVHYVLWGWMMPVPGPKEDEEDDVNEKAPTGGWPQPDSDRYVRF